MKKFLLSSIAVLGVFTLASCSGSNGTNGAKGDKGDTGENGKDGTTEFVKTPIQYQGVYINVYDSTYEVNAIYVKEAHIGTSYLGDRADDKDNPGYFKSSFSMNEGYFSISSTIYDRRVGAVLYPLELIQADAEDNQAYCFIGFRHKFCKDIPTPTN